MRHCRGPGGDSGQGQGGEGESYSQREGLAVQGEEQQGSEREGTQGGGECQVQGQEDYGELAEENEAKATGIIVIIIIYYLL